MDRESNRSRGRSTRDAQHLRDIAHLYLSGSRRTAPAESVVQRRFLLGVTGSRNSLAKVDLCANLALQFARLGQRTVVVDLDPALPNVGFRLGLSPESYLRHLEPDARPQVERGPLGVRLLVGVGAPSTALEGDAQREWREAECLLFNLPTAPESLQAIGTLQGSDSPSTTSAEPQESPRAQRRRPAARVDNDENPTRGARRSSAMAERMRTTMARAGAQSRMFGQWLETAQRRAPTTAPRPTAPSLVDAVLFLGHDGGGEDDARSLRAWGAVTGGAPVHLVQPHSVLESSVVVGGPIPWATLQAPLPGANPRHPSALLYPEHDSSRLFESLAQSLLANRRTRGDDRV